MMDHGVLAAVLEHADRAPDRPAVKDLDRALTRAELRAAAGRVAAATSTGLLVAFVASLSRLLAVTSQASSCPTSSPVAT